MNFYLIILTFPPSQNIFLQLWFYISLFWEKSQNCEIKSCTYLVQIFQYINYCYTEWHLMSVFCKSWWESMTDMSLCFFLLLFKHVWLYSFVLFMTICVCMCVYIYISHSNVQGKNLKAVLNSHCFETWNPFLSLTLIWDSSRQDF